MIEAVSRGLTDDNSDLNIEIKRSRIDISPLKYTSTNSIQSNLNESNEVLVERETLNSQVKPKSKKIKKEKEKEKENEKEKEQKEERVKEKEKQQEKEKEQKKKEEKGNVREKLKRKTKLASTTDLNSSQLTPMQHTNDENIESKEKCKPESMNHNSEKSNEKIIENVQELAEKDTTIDPSNATVLITSKDAKAISDHSLKSEAAKSIYNFSETVDCPEITTNAELNTNRKQNRKHRKEKHRNKHGPNDERSSSKEHKKKRKRKNHHHENTESFPLACGVPTIKIKVNIRILLINQISVNHFY